MPSAQTIEATGVIVKKPSGSPSSSLRAPAMIRLAGVPITVVVAGGEPAAVYPRTFSTVEELERAVDEALADAPAAG